MMNEWDVVRELPTPGVLMGQTWEVCRERPAMAIAGTLAVLTSLGVVLLGLIGMEAWFTASVLGVDPESSTALGATALFFLARLLTQGLGMGLLYALWLRLLRRQDVDASVYTAAISNVWSLSAVTALSQIGVALGSLCLLVRGLVLGLGWMLAPLYVVDRGVGPVEAMRLSWRSTMGSKLELFGVSILSTVMVLAGALSLGLGLIVAIPMTVGIVATCYQHLSKR